MTTPTTPVCTPSYRLLNAGQIDRIHAATLELLETVGVNIRHPGARDMLDAAGCTVRNDGTVLIPGQLVEDAIQSAPSAVVIYNRLGKRRCSSRAAAPISAWEPIWPKSMTSRPAGSENPP